MDTNYNVSAAMRVIVTGVAFGMLLFTVCRWRRRLGWVLGVVAVIWAGLFPFYWSDWFSTPRAVREFGDWRYFFGVVTAVLPLVLVGLGCVRYERRAA